MLADLSHYSASIMPQAPVEADPDAFFNAPYSSGPFSVTEWAKGDRILLQKNPNYWDAPQALPGRARVPHHPG